MLIKLIIIIIIIWNFSCFPVVHHFMMSLMCSVCPQCCMVSLPCWYMTRCVQKSSSHRFTPKPHFPPRFTERHRFYSCCLIIPHICTRHPPACSMTSGLSPWRTNLAFHSGSKREVSCFSVFFFFLAFTSYLHDILLLNMRNILSWRRWNVGLNARFDFSVLSLPLV